MDIEVKIQKLIEKANDTLDEYIKLKDEDTFIELKETIYKVSILLDLHGSKLKKEGD